MEQAFLVWGLGLANGLILFGLGLVVVGNRNIKSKLDTMAGNVVKLNTWAEGHEKQDDERYKNVREHIGRLYEEGKAQGATSALLTEIRDRLPDKD